MKTLLVFSFGVSAAWLYVLGSAYRVAIEPASTPAPLRAPADPFTFSGSTALNRGAYSSSGGNGRKADKDASSGNSALLRALSL